MNPFIGKNFRLNGNQLASSKICIDIKNNIKSFIQQNTHICTIQPPNLQIINVGHNIGSLSYIRKKIQMAKQLGINYHLHQFNVLFKKQNYLKDYGEVQMVLGSMNKEKFDRYQISLEEIFQKQKKLAEEQIVQIKKKILQKYVETLIMRLNQDTQVSSLFIQLPLPNQLKMFTQKLINKISPIKDADCLTKINRLKVLDDKNIPDLLPCTPRGVLKILDQNDIRIQGMDAVMIGRSDLVGKPLSHLLLNRSATTTVCHKLTKDVNFYTRNADLVISAAGVPNLVKQTKKDAILIDVGISRDQNGKLTGDISHQAKKTASFYTPVPGGVGPLTVVMLMQNVYHLWRAQQQAIISKKKISQKF